MKRLKDIITEKLRLDKNVQGSLYTCHPKTKSELRSIIKERVEKDNNADLNDIDVSQITDMSTLFIDIDPHNIKIDKWDVSNVENMGYMFMSCYEFNSDLSNWNVSNVKDMKGMFADCIKFDSDLSNWDISKVETMDYMLYHCDSLKKIPAWYIS